MKEVLFFKARQQSRQKDFYRDLMLKLGRSLTQVVSIENYEIRFSRSNYTHIPMYLCRVSFLTILNICKDYFKGYHNMMQKENTSIVWSNANCDIVHHSLRRSYWVFTPRVLWPKSFLIFIVDELKNFATNNLHQVGVLVTYWDPCING